MNVDAFPLAWPHGKPRTRNPRRGAFQVTLDRARRDLLRSLKLLGVKRSDIVISTNMPLTRFTSSGRRCSAWPAALPARK